MSADRSSNTASRYTVAGIKLGIAVHSFTPLTDALILLLQERPGERNEEARDIALRLLQSIERAMPE